MSNKPEDRVEYFATCTAIAKELADRCRSGDIGDSDELDDAIREDVDGNHYVIYIHAAYDVRVFSSHWGDCEDDVGWHMLTEGVDSLDALVCLYAYHAMIADVRDALSEIDGFDPDDDSTWTESEEEEEDNSDDDNVEEG